MVKVFSFGNDAEMLSLPCVDGGNSDEHSSFKLKSQLNSAEGNGCADARDTRHQAKVLTAALPSLATTTTFATVVSADVDTI